MSLPASPLHKMKVLMRCVHSNISATWSLSQHKMNECPLFAEMNVSQGGGRGGEWGGGGGLVLFIEDYSYKK